MPAQTTFQSFTATFAFLGQNTTATFTLVVKVSQTAAGSTITNTATITTASAQPISAGKSATVKTTLTQGGGAAPLVGPFRSDITP